MVVASVAVAVVAAVDMEIVSPDGVRDTQRRRGTTIRNHVNWKQQRRAGSHPGFFCFCVALLCRDQELLELPVFVIVVVVITRLLRTAVLFRHTLTERMIELR